MWGIANRTDFDLSSHQEHSKVNMEYFDPTTNEKYIPYVVEPSLGVERLFFAVMAEALVEEELEKDTRILCSLHPALAPYKVAVLPLSKQLNDDANKVFELCAKHFATTYDETASIGKRYRRQDAIGTPFCVTFDFDSLEDESVTIRDRDTMAQERVKIVDLVNIIQERIQL